MLIPILFTPEYPPGLTKPGCIKKRTVLIVAPPGYKPLFLFPGQTLRTSSVQMRKGGIPKLRLTLKKEAVLASTSLFQNLLNLSAPGRLSVCKFFLHYLHKMSCLVTRTKQTTWKSFCSGYIHPSQSPTGYNQTLCISYKFAYPNTLKIKSHKQDFTAC